MTANVPRPTAVIAGNDRLTPEEQAEIYREQFWLRHRDVLRDDYPALRHLLGEERVVHGTGCFELRVGD